MTEIYKTDWLGSNPVFYNEKNHAISHNINDVIDYKDLEFDPDGLFNYLDYGYSVFGHTPVKHVKFIPPNSELSILKGKLSLLTNEDPINGFLEGVSTEKEVIELIKEKVITWAKRYKNETIIIPTSGGYDSRLLNIFLKNNTNIRTFTYGVSEVQSKSQEAVFAEYITKKLGTKWKLIKLTHINSYIQKWYQLYGVSTHLHGMYHLEFYDKIQKLVPKGIVLSGIIGDAWSGNVTIPPIKKSKDVVQLGYAHGVNSDSKYCKLKPERDLAGDYFKTNKKSLKDNKFRIIESMRFKSILLSYLIKVPELYGFKTWSPFLDMEVATSMLRLPKVQRVDRAWQSEYFRKNNVMPEDKELFYDANNILDLESLNQVKIPPLDKQLLNEIIQSDYIDTINESIGKYYKYLKIYKMTQKILGISLINVIYHGLGFKYDLYSLNSKIYKDFCAYMTLKPLEMLIRQRNKYD